MFKKRECENDPTKRFKLENCLGSGAFASIYKAMDKSTKKYCAIKKIALKSKDQSEKKEFEIGIKLKHPNVITTLDCLFTNEHMYMAVELVNGGDLFTQLDPGGSGLAENIARKYMFQLANGIAYMHSQGIVHNDIKPENVLVHSGVIKVCDLGLAGDVHAERHGPATGTGAYMAPELINRKHSIPYNIEFAQDVWSVGVVLYAVLFADLPWEKAKPRDKDFNLFCRKGGVTSRLHPFNYVSPPMRQFLGMILNILPTQRPTMDQVKEFFSRKYTWFVADKSTLKISYGLKEVKAEKKVQAEKWKFDAEGNYAQQPKDTRNSSSSSVPSLHDEGFSADKANAKPLNNASPLDNFDQLEIV